MKPEIKGIFSDDIHSPDREGWIPDDPKQIYIPLTLSIGKVGEAAADLFSIVVATPSAIQGRPERRGSKLLVVQEYDWPEIRATLQRWVAQCEGPSWEATVDCLRRRFDWEYEGMGPRQ
jgi:hypothetical protein